MRDSKKRHSTLGCFCYAIDTITTNSIFVFVSTRQALFHHSKNEELELSRFPQGEIAHTFLAKEHAMRTWNSSSEFCWHNGKISFISTIRERRAVLVGKHREIVRHKKFLTLGGTLSFDDLCIVIFMRCYSYLNIN